MNDQLMKRLALLGGMTLLACGQLGDDVEELDGALITSGSIYTVKNVHSSKCLDISGGGTANGTKVQLWDCNGTGAQSWTVGANGSLVNTNSGRCLDATGPSSADGTRLQIWDCAGSANQSWTLP